MIRNKITPTRVLGSPCIKGIHSGQREGSDWSDNKTSTFNGINEASKVLYTQKKSTRKALESVLQLREVSYHLQGREDGCVFNQIIIMQADIGNLNRDTDDSSCSFN